MYRYIMCTLNYVVKSIVFTCYLVNWKALCMLTRVQVRKKQNKLRTPVH